MLYISQFLISRTYCTAFTEISFCGELQLLIHRFNGCLEKFIIAPDSEIYFSLSLSLDRVMA
jgi:uncharacterized membrane protein